MTVLCTPAPPPGPTPWRLRWLPSQYRKERELLFFSLVGILSLTYAGFAIACVWLDFVAGSVLSLIALVVTLVLGGMRRAGVSIRALSAAMQATLLLHATSVAWLTGGVYSPTLGWLALAPLPAAFLYSVRSSLYWLAGVCSIVLLLYAHAWLGGEGTINLNPIYLMHWHMGMAIIILAAQIVMLYRFQSLRRHRLVQLYMRNRKLQTARRELKDSQKHKDKFVAAVSHELRTPMTAILGLADVIDQSEGLSDDTREKIRGIQRSANHLLATINDLLDYSQMEAGKLQINVHAIDLHTTLAGAFNLLKHRAKQKSLECTLDIHPDVPQWVEADDHRLTQILVNLLGNAVKFTSEGGVSLSARIVAGERDDGRHITLVFEVKDTGAGMTAEQLSNLFNDYAQADITIARRFGGNGLGLSISRGLVSAMDGEISVTSEPGKGSCFRVEIPTKQAKPVALEPAGNHLDRPDLVMRILLAEDEPINRQVAKLMIHRSMPKVVVEEAENGRKAVAMAGERHYDLILMDLVMPELGGMDAAKAIRETLPAPANAVSIVALTAHTDRDVWGQCRTVGMNDILLKPYDRNKLLSTIVQYAPSSPEPT